jgi:hypothetical protein
MENVNNNNFYGQTYNWNLYSPFKIPGEFLDPQRNDEIKRKKEIRDFQYVS